MVWGSGRGGPGFAVANFLAIAFADVLGCWLWFVVRRTVSALLGKCALWCQALCGIVWRQVRKGPACSVVRAMELARLGPTAGILSWW